MTNLPPDVNPEYFNVTHFLQKDIMHSWDTYKTVIHINYTACPQDNLFEFTVHDNQLFCVAIKYPNYKCAFYRNDDETKFYFTIHVLSHEYINYKKKFMERSITDDSAGKNFDHYFNYVIRAQIVKAMEFIVNQGIERFPKYVIVFFQEYHKDIMKKIGDYYIKNGTTLSSIFIEMFNDQTNELWDPTENDNICFL